MIIYSPCPEVQVLAEIPRSDIALGIKCPRYNTNTEGGAPGPRPSDKTPAQHHRPIQDERIFAQVLNPRWRPDRITSQGANRF